MESKLKIVATNRKARRDYTIIEVFEAGMELLGNEVKSLRTKNCSIEESFGRIENNEVFIYNMHVSEYSKTSYFAPDPKRKRKLLLHKKEIERLAGLTSQRGFTVIPLKVYFNPRGIAKVEIALAKGRLLYDKRKKIREEMTDRDTERELRRFSKGR